MCAVALLIQAADRWKSEHNGSLPKSYVEKQEFKDLLRGWQHKIDGVPIEVGSWTSWDFTCMRNFNAPGLCQVSKLTGGQ